MFSDFSRYARVKLLLLHVLAACLLLSSCKRDCPEELVHEFYKTYALSGNQEANCLIAVGEKIYIIGTTNNGGIESLFILCTDLNGEQLWYKQLEGGTAGKGVTTDGAGNLVVIGNIKETDNKDILLVKFDPDGNELWRQTHGSPFDDIGNDVIRSLQGYVLLGTTQGFNTDVAGIYLIRTGGAGEAQLTRIIDGDGLDGGTEMVAVPNTTEILMLGFTESYGASDRDMFLMRMTHNLDSIWSHQYGGSGYEESQAIAWSSLGDFLICGHSASEEPNHSVYGLKIDANGNILWEKHFGTPSAHEGGEAVISDVFGYPLFIGRSNSFGNDEQVYLIKTDYDGNILEELNFGEAGDQRANDAIRVDANDENYLFLAGTSVLNGDADVLLIKRPM